MGQDTAQEDRGNHWQVCLRILGADFHTHEQWLSGLFPVSYGSPSGLLPIPAISVNGWHELHSYRCNMSACMYTTEIKNATGIDCWLGGDFNRSHT